LLALFPGGLEAVAKLVELQYFRRG
jgi:hypothetical protein